MDGRQRDPRASRSGVARRPPCQLASRLASLLVAATLALIGVGGLVTTYQAGMAVPDWPNTYGYVLVLYPWRTWLAGPWDLFVEHGHRLLGMAVGLLSIALLMAVWRSPRRHLRLGAGVVLTLIVLQGLLGGLRVLLDARRFALVHGITAPIVFASIALVASWIRREQRAGAAAVPAHDARFSAFGPVACLVYLQIVLGANIRHVADDAHPSWFQTLVLFHLLVAAAVLVYGTSAVWRSMRGSDQRRRCGVPLLWLGLAATQVGLGLGTWVVQFGYPAFLQSYTFAARYVVVAEGMWQSLVTTLHVVAASALLGLSVVLGIRWMPAAAGEVGVGEASRPGPLMWEAAS